MFPVHVGSHGARQKERTLALPDSNWEQPGEAHKAHKFRGEWVVLRRGSALIRWDTSGDY